VQGGTPHLFHLSIFCLIRRHETQTVGVFKKFSEIKPRAEDKKIPPAKYHPDSLAERMGQLYQRPKRLVLLLVGSIFFADALGMLLLDSLPAQSLRWHALIDTILMAAILSPVLYLLYFRPLKHHLAALRSSEREIKYLSQRLIESAEEHHRKLARDLHDEFGLGLTNLVFGIEELQTSLPAELAGAIQDCDHLLNDLQDLGIRVREFSSDLHPACLDALGIEDALQELVQKYSRLHPELMVEFKVYGLKNILDPEIETVLYRVCQECLNNVFKHSHADQINIRLTYSHPQVILTVQDNGIGFDLQHIEADPRTGRQGIGLLGMRERVTMVGGRFSPVSQLGQGTQIRVELPGTLSEGTGK